jgi:hypothetical protein
MADVDGHRKVHPHMRGLLRGLRMTPPSVTFITSPDELRWFVSSSWNAFEIPSGTVPVGRSS